MSETKDMNKCHICNLKIDSDQLELHFCEVHSSENKCDNCDKSFFKKESLEIHFDREHVKSSEQNRLRKIKCSSCDKEYYDQSKLNVHIRTFHEKIRRFQCDTCHKSFFYRYQMKKHITEYR